MGIALEFMREEHEDILDNGYSSKHCGVLAKKIAEMSLNERKVPHICLVYEETKEGGGTGVKSFTPIILIGKMDPWHGHSVCCVGDTVLDPLIGEPVSKNEYTQRCFGEKIAMKVSVPVGRIMEHVYL